MTQAAIVGRDPKVVVGASVAATIATVFPGFLIGAVAVQASEEFDISEGTYGWGLAGFFLAAMLGSVVLGRLAQRVGPRRQVSTALLVSAAAQLAIATLANRFALVVVCLAVAGFANAANQTGINLLLTRANVPRLGLALAIKQSGMPTASLLSGFAVPVFALTVGWRWAYVLSAAVTVAAFVNVRRVTGPIGPMARGERATLQSSRRSLLIAASSGMCMAFAAGALNSWLVSSGVDAGMGEGLAGLMLSLGAGCGIAVRLVIGFRLDGSRTRPFLWAGGLSLGGAGGIALLAVGSPAAHIVATLIAFGAGWVWPVFTNFGIVRANAASAGSATGLTQMGVYIGIFIAPLLTGWVIETSGYRAMWLLVAATMACGSLLAFTVADDF